MVVVSVIGCGNLGSALIKGLSRSGTHDVTAYDIDSNALESVAPYCRRTTTDIDEAAESDVVVLAVKPDVVDDVLRALDLSSDQTLVTAAAGVPVEFVENRTDATVVRIMPNLAAETGDMAAAVTWAEPDADVRRLLDDLGAAVEIDEDLMDTATALNGSGPAFVFYVLEAMKRAGVEAGLSADDAELLAAQTFKGAAETVLRSDRSVDELIDAVCSPKGTTIEGMRVLRGSDVEPVIGDALRAATERARELAEEVDGE
jgi:pyrroline-5-carboxylate reductase